MKLEPFFFLLFLFVLIFVGIKYLYRSRATAMRALAARWSFQYSDGDPRMWSAGRIDSPSLIVLKMRTAFEMRCQPANVISRVWNVIDGERNGIRVLIFDSTVFEGKGRYRTFVATLTSENLFESDSSREKIAQCSGWTAAYRIRFIQIPWTLTITRIEELLNNL
jgi:hypothetical protein